MPLCKAGDRQALDRLVARNKPFVYAIARRAHRRCRFLELEDLVAVGQLGLVHAVDKYDPNLGTKFLTFAAWWVRATIEREWADHDRTVRVPVHLLDVQRKVYLGTYQGSAKKRERALAAHGQFTRSFDAPVGGEDSATLGDLLGSEGPSAEDALGVSEVEAAVRAAIARMPLTERDRLVVEQRMLGDKTLKEVGDALGVSRERVRQMEEKLRERLRKELADLRD